MINRQLRLVPVATSGACLARSNLADFQSGKRLLLRSVVAGRAKTRKSIGLPQRATNMTRGQKLPLNYRARWMGHE